MAEAPRYDIERVTDFLKVPEDRLEDCLREFAIFLEMARGITELADAIADDVRPDVKKAVPGLLKSYTWIDDGKKNCAISFGRDETKSASNKTCVWLEDEHGAWTTACNNCFEFTNNDGPTKNGFVVCPYCKLKIKIKR